jgi:hypothetical protein
MGRYLLALSGLLVLYGAERYSALTQEETAYVYHPETDDVYTVVFGAAPDRLFKKQLLLPFHTLSREIKITEARGSMHRYLRDKAAADTRFSPGRSPVSIESVTAQVGRWASTSLDSVRAFGYRWDFPDLAWVPRRDVAPRELMPLALAAILPTESATWFWEDVYTVDAVVVEEYFQIFARTAGSAPTTVRTLEKAIMIRGQAAEYLERVLFGGSPLEH